MTKLTQETLIPIGTAILVIGLGASWVTDISKEIRAHAQDIERSRELNIKLEDRLRGIERQLIEIDLKLGKTFPTYKRTGGKLDGIDGD